jgi:hypothetical protein
MIYDFGDFGDEYPDFGFWILDFGFWILDGTIHVLYTLSPAHR